MQAFIRTVLQFYKEAFIHLKKLHTNKTFDFSFTSIPYLYVYLNTHIMRLLVSMYKQSPSLNDSLSQNPDISQKIPLFMILSSSQDFLTGLDTHPCIHT